MKKNHSNSLHLNQNDKHKNTPYTCLNYVSKSSVLLFFFMTVSQISKITFAQNEFIITIKTTSPNESFAIPTSTVLYYNYSVDWGNNITVDNVTSNATITYAKVGTYTIKISGTFPRIYFDNYYDDRDKVSSIGQWGTIEWATKADAFAYCDNVVLNATGIPDLSKESQRHNQNA